MSTKNCNKLYINFIYILENVAVLQWFRFDLACTGVVFTLICPDGGLMIISWLKAQIKVWP